MLNFKIIFKYAFKDLARQKVRTAIGIIGVMISVGLLALVLFLSDSISVTFANYLSIDAGNQDMLVRVRHYNNEPVNRSNYFDFNPLVSEIKSQFPEINNYIPRMEIYGNINISSSIESQELTNQQTYVLLSGINFTLERSINFGAFIKPDSNDLMDLNQLNSSQCAIYHGFSKEIKYKENDTIEVRMGLQHNGTNHFAVRNFTIAKIFDYQLKWPISYTNRHLIVLNINTLYELFGNSTFWGKCNNLIMTIKEPENYYDVRNLESSEDSVKDLAGEIQILIGLNEYYIDLPKLEVLGFSEWLSVGITIIFVFVSMISMLISGVLINGILKTSVEERIREFGIFRTLGATKSHNLMVVLIQGFLLCNFGTILGIIFAQLATQFIILPFAGTVISGTIPGLAGNVAYSATLFSFISSYIIGITVGIIVSLSPAIQVLKLQLIESIHPYRHEDTLYHLQKKATINYKLIIVGLILAANGLFVIIAIPRILLTGNLALISGILIALLIIFLIGTTLAGLGLIPVVLHIFIQGFRLISRKLSPVYKIFIFRYARRNTSTVLIFAFTFSFVIFTSGAFRFLSDEEIVETKLGLGSDLLIETIGWEDPEENDENGGFGSPDGIITLNADSFSVDPGRILTTEFEDLLLQLEGIEKVSSVLASPYHLTQIYSEPGKEFSAEIGDYAGLTTQEISLIGIDEEYPSTVDTNFFQFTKGNLENSFSDLFNSEEGYSCIISEALANNLDLNLGALVRIIIYRGDESEIYTFNIVGIAAHMPGFAGIFSQSTRNADLGGVMISHHNYVELMDIPPIPYLDKVFVKLTESWEKDSWYIEELIEKDYQREFDFEIENLRRSISQGISYFSILNTFFTITLDATIIICLFGLISSSYSTIIERKKEIGIIRTLGLKGGQINRLFTIEALIIMFSSGSIGVLVGYSTGLLLTTSLNLLSDLPTPANFPFESAINVFLISTIFTFIGMYLLIRKLRKKKIVEIYRETM